MIEGLRSLEIRSWLTKYRGPLLIQASLGTEKRECRRLNVKPGETGVILGIVDLVDVKKISTSEWSRLRDCHLMTGPRPYGKKTFAWLLRNPVKFKKSVPFSGKLGLYNVPDKILPRPFKLLKSGRIVESYAPGRYAGNTTHRIFGRLDCKSGKRLMMKKNRVFFRNWQDAVDAGYRPCKNCGPTPADEY